VEKADMVALGARPEKNEFVARIIFVSIGIILLVASAAKLYAWSGSTNVNFGPPAWTESRLPLDILVIIEWSIGTCLIIRVFPKRVVFVTAFMFGCFTGVSLYEWILQEPSCGCFGSLSPSPKWTLGLDLIVLLALSYVWALAPRSFWAQSLSKREIACGVISICIGTGIFLNGTRANATFRGAGFEAIGQRTIVLKPNEWVGRRFSLFSYIDIGERLKQGDWLLIFYHNDCSACREKVPKYEKEAKLSDRTEGGLRTVFIEMPPYSAGADQLVEAGFHMGKLDDRYDWFVKTPLVVRIRNGIVVSSAEDLELSVNSREVGLMDGESDPKIGK